MRHEPEDPERHGPEDPERDGPADPKRSGPLSAALDAVVILGRPEPGPVAPPPHVPDPPHIKAQCRTLPLSDGAERNAPCACGSGKRYKHCCERRIVTEPGFVRHVYAEREKRR